jgi:hypothetical protein
MARTLPEQATSWCHNTSAQKILHTAADHRPTTHSHGSCVTNNVHDTG